MMGRQHARKQRELAEQMRPSIDWAPPAPLKLKIKPTPVDSAEAGVQAQRNSSTAGNGSRCIKVFHSKQKHTALKAHVQPRKYGGAQIT